MKRIIAFGASNSRNSINHKLAIWTAAQLDDVEIIRTDLNKYEMPIYSIDRERENGIPEKAQAFKKMIREADGIIISFAEHNGSYTVAFKNILDWISRLGRPIWEEKPVFLMATSPGSRGGRSVLSTAVKTFPHQGANLIAQFSLPSFRENFDMENGIPDDTLYQNFKVELLKFSMEIQKNPVTRLTNE